MPGLLTFHPIYQERIWGGRRLEDLYQRRLPPERPIGESWEVVDRSDAESVIARGPHQGKTLNWMLRHHGEELFGSGRPVPERFPWLIKILDAREKLSLQVHPPGSLARELGGESKTEMWYFTDTRPGADIFVGLKKGVTREAFAQHLEQGTVDTCIHRIETEPGDCMFLPSGRVHALGAGNVLFEIQENSDTTYRVFDWNRVGLDGKPRELHVAESMRSIDFSDFEPGMIESNWRETTFGSMRELVRNPLFDVDVVRLNAGVEQPLPGETLQVIGTVSGVVKINGDDDSLTLKAGNFSMIPAAFGQATVVSEDAAEFLQVR